MDKLRKKRYRSNGHAHMDSGDAAGQMQAYASDKPFARNADAAAGAAHGDHRVHSSDSDEDELVKGTGNHPAVTARANPHSRKALLEGITSSKAGKKRRKQGGNSQHDPQAPT